MRTIRVFALVALAMLSLRISASASDLTGIYVATQHGGVEYFNLTDQGGILTGYLQIVTVDTNASDGVNRQSIGISGSVSGSRAVLHLSRGLNSYEWTADLGWNGFTVNIPMRSGQISQAYFRRSSVAEVNRLVASLTQSGNTAKYYANAQAELADSEQRLANDVNNYRPQTLAEMRNAKAELAGALAVKKKAQQNLLTKKTIAAQKHAEAEQARQTAQTSDEEVRAGDMEAAAGDANAEVGDAIANLTAANVDVQDANRHLASAKADLVRVDARISQLHQIIARDKAILHIH